MMNFEDNNKNYINDIPFLICRDKTEEFNITKKKHQALNKDGEDLLIIKFKQAALKISSILNTESLEIHKMVHNCCICGSKFGKIFNKKQKCLVCNTIVCSNCNSNSVPLSSLNIQAPPTNTQQSQNNQQQQSIMTCNVCFNSLKIIIKRFEYQRLSMIANSSDFVQFYEQMQLNIFDLKKNLPNFKSLVSQIQNNNSPLIPKAKSLEQSISMAIKEMESGIRQLKQLQGSTTKQTQLINNIKHSFASYLQTSIPEFKITCSTFSQKLLITENNTNSIIKSSSSNSQSTSSPILSSQSNSSNSSSTSTSLIIPNSNTGELEINIELLNSLSLKEINDEIKSRGGTIPPDDSRKKQEVLKQLKDILNVEIFSIETNSKTTSSGRINNSNSNSSQDLKNDLSSPPLFSSIFNSFSNLLSDIKNNNNNQQTTTTNTNNNINNNNNNNNNNNIIQQITEPSEAKYVNGQIVIMDKLLTSLSLKEMNDEIRIRGYAVPIEQRGKADVYLLLRDILIEEIDNKSLIVSVVPAVCPQNGCFVTITGENLNKKSIEIQVGSIKIKPFKQNIHAIMFLSPGQPQEGEVELVISDGKLVLAKQFLFFTNSCFQTEEDISNINDYALDMFQKSTTSPLFNSKENIKNNNNNQNNFDNNNNNDNEYNNNNNKNNNNNNSFSSSNIIKTHSRNNSNNSNSNSNSNIKSHSRNNSINDNNNIIKNHSRNSSLTASPIMKSSSPNLKSFGNHNNNNSNSNSPSNDSFSILMSKEIGSTGESFDDLVVEMIHPTVMPLSGTKVSVQFKNPIKGDSLKVKIGYGSNFQTLTFETSNAERKISFQTPSLSQGSYNLEFIQDSKKLALDNILFYDSSLTPQPTFVNTNSGFNNNSGFNSNNNNFNISNQNNYYYKEQPKIMTSSRVIGGKKN